MKRIIVNADDFGLTEGINEAVVRAYREGILTSASLMANGPAFEHAVRLAKDNPGLGVGVHLNIVRGRPVCAAQRSGALAGPDGMMGGVMRLAAQLARGRIGPAELEEEFSAQIGKVVAAGITPTHLDSEKHAHALPPVLAAAAAAGKRFGIRRIRNVHQRLSAGYVFNLKAAGFSLCEALGMRRARVRYGILSPDEVFGVFDGGRVTKELLLRVFEEAGEGTTEIVCHPGPDGMPPETERAMGKFRLVSRARELQALIDPGVKDAAARLHIDLIPYGHMKEEK